MQETHPEALAFDGALFNENRNHFPHEELAKYRGRHVAWNLLGTRIVASGADYEELFRNIDAAGLALSQVVQSYVPSEAEDTLI